MKKKPQHHSNSTLSSRDLSVLWHPCTQMKDHENIPLIPIKRAEGVYLIDHQDKRYIDGISSWWVNILGHNHPNIVAAIQEQAAQLQHSIFAGFTHQPAIELAETLVDITPSGLQRVFYGENGSSAVEIALKMSVHYWLNQGRPNKHKFVNLANGYHGETIAALSVSDVALYKQQYGSLLLEGFTAPSPDCFYRESGESWHDYSVRQFEKMSALLEKHHHQIAAVIVEPLVQCAGYMRMYHPIYLSLLKSACEKLDIHLIADEIAVGFGRTGTLFACEQANITPDILCLSKGLTGGALPLSAVITTETMYQAFYDDYKNLTAFLHSHSFTGNPIGCSAALACIQTLQNEHWIEKNQHLIQQLKQLKERFSSHPHVGDVRQTGTILAIEMMKDPVAKIEYDWQERRGMVVYQYALEQGALLRPLGNVIYFMTPYVIQEEELNRLADIAWQGIELATRD